MRDLSLFEMESLHGESKIPKWFKCGAAIGGTVLFFGSILAGNVAAAIVGPTVVGAAWASCATD